MDGQWDLETIKKVAVGVAVSVFFGLLRYAQAFLEASERPRFIWWVWAIKGATSGGVGFLTTLLCIHWSIDWTVAGFLIGSAGWGGAETINAFKEMALDSIRKRLGGGGAPEDTANQGPEI